MRNATMSDQDIGNELTGGSETTQDEASTKTYTQADLDKHLAGLRRKYERQLEGLGDIEELKQLKTQAESKKLEDAKKRGEFDKLMQELATKKDQEIQKRDLVIRDYKINTPLLTAAANHKAVNADQVKALLASNIRLNDEGDVEVIDSKGSVRYTDKGKLLSVDDLVSEFLQQNPHFVAATPATTNTKSSIGMQSKEVDVNQLDLRKAEHREIYKRLSAKK
jgi:hypothetical protein